MKINEGPLNLLKGMRAASNVSKAKGRDREAQQVKLKQAAANRFATDAGYRRRIKDLTNATMTKWLNRKAILTKHSKQVTSDEFLKWLKRFMGKNRPLPAFNGDMSDANIKRYLESVVKRYYTNPGQNKNKNTQGDIEINDNEPQDFSLSNKEARRKKLLPVIQAYTDRLNKMEPNDPKRDILINKIEQLTKEIQREATERLLLLTFLSEHAEQK